MAAVTYPQAVNTSPYYSVKLRRFALYSTMLLFATIVAVAYLLPFGNMALMSIKSQDQMVISADGPIWPMEPNQYTYEGKDYDIYNVPLLDGTTKELALIKKGRQVSEFIDPANPEAGFISWEGNWRGLDQAYTVLPHFENFPTAWNMIEFPKLFFNTIFIAVVGIVGTLLSSICVAYAFARFPIPGKNILFIILIGTIILPGQVTLIPTYTVFARMGWTGALGWLPLTVPHFFANAYNVFLLRQFFLTLPRELDEAAMIDGASPFQVLTKVIIPQAWPALIAVALFHFVFAWNDYFGPLIYLAGNPDRQVISVGVQAFNYAYGQRPELVQATSLMGMVLPLVLFFIAQRVFMRGVVITGVEK
jgi:multiple sugar transport system permease protein